MAKHTLDNNNGFDVDLDLPEFDGDMGPEIDPSSRSPSTPVSNFSAGIQSSMMDTDNIARGLKNVLPDEYSTAWDAVDEGLTFADDVKEEIKKTLGPEVRKLKQVGGALLPSVSKILPKSVTEKLERLTATDEDRAAYVQQTQAQIDEQSIASALGAIWQADEAKAEVKEQLNAEKEITEKAETEIRENYLAERTLSVDSSIRAFLERMATYQDEVTSAYQKRSLELKFRHYFAARDLLELSKGTLKDAVASLKAIAHNTALPDSRKELQSEMFRKMRDQALYGRALSSLGGMFSGYMDRMKGQIMERVRGSTGILQQLLGAVSQAGEMHLQTQVMGDLGESNQADLTDEQQAEMQKAALAKSAGSGLFNYLFAKAGEKLRPHVAKSERVQDIATQLAYYTENAPQIINEQLRKESDIDVGYESLNVTLNAIVDFLKKGLTPVSGYGESIQSTLSQHATRVSQFDELTRRSIIEIIPGYLSRILQNVESIATGKTDTDRTVYDVETESFQKQQSVISRFKEKITGPSKAQSVQSSMDRFFDLIDVNKKLTEDDKVYLRERILRELARGNQKFNPYDYSPSSMSELPEPQRKRISSAIQSRFHRDEKGTDAASSNVRNEALRRFKQIAQSVPSTQSLIHSMTDTGQKEILTESGLFTDQGRLDTGEVFRSLSQTLPDSKPQTVTTTIGEEKEIDTDKDLTVSGLPVTGRKTRRGRRRRRGNVKPVISTDKKTVVEKIKEESVEEDKKEAVVSDVIEDAMEKMGVGDERIIVDQWVAGAEEEKVEEMEEENALMASEPRIKPLRKSEKNEVFDRKKDSLISYIKPELGKLTTVKPGLIPPLQEDILPTEERIDNALNLIPTTTFTPATTPQLQNVPLQAANTEGRVPTPDKYGMVAGIPYRVPDTILDIPSIAMEKTRKLVKEGIDTGIKAPGITRDIVTTTGEFIKDKTRDLFVSDEGKDEKESKNLIGRLNSVDNIKDLIKERDLRGLGATVSKENLLKLKDRVTEEDFNLVRGKVESLQKQLSMENIKGLNDKIDVKKIKDSLTDIISKDEKEKRDIFGRLKSRVEDSVVGEFTTAELDYLKKKLSMEQVADYLPTDTITGIKDRLKGVELPAFKQEKSIFDIPFEEKINNDLRTPKDVLASIESMMYTSIGGESSTNIEKANTGEERVVSVRDDKGFKDKLIELVTSINSTLLTMAGTLDSNISHDGSILNTIKKGMDVSSDLLSGGISLYGEILGGVGSVFKSAKEGFQEGPIVDIYFYGENESKPRLFRRKLARGSYLDLNSKKIVHRLDDITGAVVDTTNGENTMVVTEEEFKTGNLYRADKAGMGRNLMDKATDYAKTALGFSLDTSTFLFSAPKIIMEKTDKLRKLLGTYTDVYVSGQTSPVMLAHIMRRGGYFSAQTGKPIFKLSDIDGPVVDVNGNHVLTMEQLTEGIYDNTGKKIDIRGGFEKAFDFMHKYVRKQIERTMKVAKSIYGFGKKMAGKAFGKVKGKIQKTFGLDKESHSITERLNDLSVQVMEVMPDVSGAMLDIVNKTVAMQEQMSGIFQTSYKETAEALTGIKDTSLRQVELLEHISHILEERLDVPEDVRAGSWQSKLAAGAKQKKTGDNIIPFPTPMHPGQVAANEPMEREAEKTTTENIIDRGIDYVKERTVDRVLDRGKRAAGKRLGRVAGTMGKGAIGLGGKALSLVPGKAAIAGAAGKALGVGATVASKAAIGATAIGGVLSAPVVLGTLAVGGLGYGAYRLYRGSQRDKIINREMSEQEKLRLMQYGINPENDDEVKAIRILEQYAIDNATISGEGDNITVSFDIKDEEDFTGIAEEFGLDIEDNTAVMKWYNWYRDRFVPVLSEYVKVLKMKDIGDVFDYDALSEEDKISKIVGKLRIPENTYYTKYGPFGSMSMILPASIVKDKRMELLTSTTGKIENDVPVNITPSTKTAEIVKSDTPVDIVPVTTTGTTVKEFSTEGEVLEGKYLPADESESMVKRIIPEDQYEKVIETKDSSVYREMVEKDSGIRQLQAQEAQRSREHKENIDSLNAIHGAVLNNGRIQTAIHATLESIDQRLMVLENKKETTVVREPFNIENLPQPEPEPRVSTPPIDLRRRNIVNEV